MLSFGLMFQKKKKKRKEKGKRRENNNNSRIGREHPPHLDVEEAACGLTNL